MGAGTRFSGKLRFGRAARAALLPVVVALALAGCSSDATAPQETGTIAVFGTLFVGEALPSFPDTNAVHVTRVRPIDERYDREEAAVDDAVVTLLRDGAAAPDTLSLRGAGAYGNPNVVIRPNTMYRLRVEVPGHDPITAATTTPDSSEIAGGPPPFVPEHESLQDRYPILVRCGNPEQVFLVDAYCRETWVTARYVNPFGSHNAPDDDEEYGGENGEPRHIFAYFRIEQVIQSDGAYVIDFYSAMMAFFGAYDIQVLAIDANLYNYLYRDHPEENGGIRGGIGLFGSAQRRVWHVTTPIP